jgi:deazaflavin-dependent oxidoreductase (nitroreductase family)
VNLKNAERTLFRLLNTVVEPAVRSGIASPAWTPGSAIVLETTGFKTGRKRSTPLLALRLGDYTLIATYRGGRSFWVKNLHKQSQVRYYLGGKPRDSRAYAVSPEARATIPDTLPGYIGRLADLLAVFNRVGWAFAILVPEKSR